MFAIELVVPFGIFVPRLIHLVAASLITMFQLGIFFTGNYNFFNILTIALSIFLLDDAMLKVVLPNKSISFLEAVAVSFLPQLPQNTVSASLPPSLTFR